MTVWGPLPELTTQQLTLYSGTPAHRIRAYQDNGWIAPARDTPHGGPRWPVHTLRLLALISLAEDAALNSEQTGEFLGPLTAELPALSEWRTSVLCLDLRVAQRAAEHAALRDEITKCERCTCERMDSCLLLRRRLAPALVLMPLHLHHASGTDTSWSEP